jgi:hypothetical protein
MFPLKGGERIFIIGEWSAPDSTTTYSMNLNGQRIGLRQLNQHVLECTLPRFDSIYSNRNESTVNNIVLCNNQYVLNTCIHVYENEVMCCAPAPFQIKFTRKISLTEPPKKSTTAATLSAEVYYETLMKSYKNQLFLLERGVLVCKMCKFDTFEYSLNSGDETATTAVDSAHAKAQLEQRITQLVRSLGQHLLTDRNNNSSAFTSGLEAKVRLDGEHEGKTLLHLSCALNMSSLFETLIDLKKSTSNRHRRHQLISTATTTPTGSLELIENELNLLKLDQDGFTPMVINDFISA